MDIDVRCCVKHSHSIVFHYLVNMVQRGFNLSSSFNFHTCYYYHPRLSWLDLCSPVSLFQLINIRNNRRLCLRRHGVWECSSGPVDRAMADQPTAHHLLSSSTSPKVFSMNPLLNFSNQSHQPPVFKCCCYIFFSHGIKSVFPPVNGNMCCFKFVSLDGFKATS